MCNVTSRLNWYDLSCIVLKTSTFFLLSYKTWFYWLWSIVTNYSSLKESVGTHQKVCFLPNIVIKGDLNAKCPDNPPKRSPYLCLLKYFRISIWPTFECLYKHTALPYFISVTDKYNVVPECYVFSVGFQEVRAHAIRISAVPRSKWIIQIGNE